MWGTPRRFESLLAYVPLPTPGHPRKTHCTFLSAAPLLAADAAALWTMLVGNLGSCGAEGDSDEKAIALASGDLEAADLRRRWRAAIEAQTRANKIPSVLKQDRGGA